MPRHLSKFKLLLVLLLMFFVAVFSISKPSLNFNKCAKLGKDDKPRCYVVWMEEFSKHKTLGQTLGLVDFLYKSDPFFQASCHDHMHTLGKIFFEKTQSEKNLDGESFSISQDNSFCGYGFYHGFMENLISRGGSISLAQNYCSMVARPSRNQTSHMINCFHGVGHGAALMFEDEIRENNFKNAFTTSFKICETVTDDPQILDGCIMGVVDGVGAQLNVIKNGVEPDSLFRLCLSVKPVYKKACYTGFSWYALNFFNGDVAQTVSRIVNSVEKEYVGYVVETTGTDLLVLQKNNNQLVDVLPCRLIQTSLKGYCVSGFMAGYMTFGNIDFEEQKALVFCDNELNDDNDKAICFDKLITKLASQYSQDRTDKFCNSLSGDRRSMCLDKVKLLN